ncbi:MAG: FAD:protein FMN transferase [Micromonosporaceae bacterium]|nr:FAD:protein FMN transferase [Micromonosporaceae bacterium]
MSMPISIHLRGEGLDTPETLQAVRAVFVDLREAEALFSTFRADSQVSAINRGELLAGDAHRLVQEVISLCEQAREVTGGYFDAYLPRPDGTRWFNPAGLVKGWAVERAAARFRELGGRDFCINAGGDIIVGGSRPWRIGVEDPTDLGQFAATIEVTSGAVATSGSTYRGVHIVVPATGTPAREVLTATVFGESLTWADVYATAACARGSGALRWLGTLRGYAGMVVKPGGAALVTANWLA